jgi:membrane-bound ClpP family serine protease
VAISSPEFESSIMPDAAVLATMLLLLGLFLLGLEFFIPSFGMILAVASVSLIVSFWSACKAWWGVNPAFFWTYIFLLVAGIPGSLLSAIAIMQKTSLGNRLILRPPPKVESPDFNPLDRLIGQRGVTQTLLTPGGMVLVDSERFHGESLGMLIEPQMPVVVVAVKANRIVVRPWTADDQIATQRAPNSVAAARPFDLPEIAAPKLPVEQTSDSSKTRERLDFEIPDDYTRPL